MNLPTARGEELPQSKLNAVLVRRIRMEKAALDAEIRRLREKSNARALAARYRVCVSTVEKVLNYTTWRHVRDD